MNAKAAAFFAISDLCSAVGFVALAFPPFSPPSLPSSTAAGLRVAGVGTEARATDRRAAWQRRHNERIGIMNDETGTTNKSTRIADREIS